MAREIKFRAWDKKEKKWLFGYDYPNLGGFSLVGEVVLSGELSSLSMDKLFEDVEFMQYTGLKDKNGVEIYESDVFHMGDPNILYVVEWFDTGFQGRQITNKSRVGLLHWRDRINVTTNIYQNPELLNTKP